MAHTTGGDSSQPTLLTLSEVCSRYKLSRSILYRLHRSGALKIIKCGRASRIAAADIEAWAASLPTMGR
ncbi:helix-turn-helix domain-containing protein [Sphingobium nicotianae]|uniref:Helix-turn-helix domain-containing protein n=1 Tax=Sphingobium nicotianae TaxID=2782607 RepID=A0A9X1DB97_9SPHN|nr:helix-turn-helix domain-containing protein [Sphingobium nicotianae]